MATTDYEILTLPNSLRCVLRRAKGVSYIGLVVGTGSRDERPGRFGLAHFVEHTIFKGTTRRRACHISSRMECIGGELNAYTTKEETLLYTIAPSGYVERALELLADLVCDSTFPGTEIDREKEVVIDEINSYLDTPAEAVFDEFDDKVYAGSALGHNILGTPESVRSLTGADCRDFVRRGYTPSNMVLYLVADIEPQKAYKLVERYFGHMDHAAAPDTRIVPPILPLFDETRNTGRHQCHTVMGARVFGRSDARRYALFLLNNHLGGPAMNSLLNRELRDKRGYVYAVESSVALMSDCGLMQVYFGCDPEHVRPCRKIVEREIARLAETTMKPRVFDTVRRQYLGQLQVAASYADNQAMNLGKSVLYYGSVRDISTTTQALLALTPADLRDAAALVAERGLSSLTLS